LASKVYRENNLADIGYLRWKYEGNPYGVITSVCDNGGQVVGFNALILVPMKVSDSEVRSAIGGDSMVHPEFRRQGIFVATTRHLEDQCHAGAKENVYMIYGTQSLKSATVQGITKHLAYRHIGDIVILKQYFSPIFVLTHLRSHYPTLTLRNPVKYLGALTEVVSTTLFGYLGSLVDLLGGSIRPQEDRHPQVREIAPLTFGDEFDDLWQRIQQTMPVAIIKRSAYLNWRYNNPKSTYIGFRADRDGELQGFCLLSYITKEELKTAWVLDLVGTNPETEADLIRQASRRAKRDGAHILILWRTNHMQSFLPRFRLGLGKSWRNHPLVIHTLDHTSKTPEDIVGDISNWYVTVADTEDWT